MAKEAAQTSVVVVGAGLVGAMTAVFLGRRGYKVQPRRGGGRRLFPPPLRRAAGLTRSPRARVRRWSCTRAARTRAAARAASAPAPAALAATGRPAAQILCCSAAWPGAVCMEQGHICTHPRMHTYIHDNAHTHTHTHTHAHVNSAMLGRLGNATKRSINLALSHRGLCALQKVCVRGDREMFHGFLHCMCALFVCTSMQTQQTHARTWIDGWIWMGLDKGGHHI